MVCGQDANMSQSVEFISYIHVIPFRSDPLEFLFLEVGLRSGFISARADAPAATAFLSLEVFWEMDLGLQDAGSERSCIRYILICHDAETNGVKIHLQYQMEQ